MLTKNKSSLICKLLAIHFFLLIVVVTVFAQRSKNALVLGKLEALISKVQKNAKKNASAYFNDYQFKYESTTEHERAKKTTSTVAEYYCLENGKSCRSIILSRNGKARSPSKIRKNRRKTARKFAKEDKSSINRSYRFYGVSFGKIPVWIDPSIFLRVCEKQFAYRDSLHTRESVVINVACSSLLPSKGWYKARLSFMSKTEAEIWIDVQDESIVKMNVYAKKEFSSSQARKPIIILETTRTPEGFWLFKTVRLETIGNKLVFPKLKNNYQFNFFDYKHLQIEVESKVNKPISKK